MSFGDWTNSCASTHATVLSSKGRSCSRITPSGGTTQAVHTDTREKEALRMPQSLRMSTARQSHGQKLGRGLGLVLHSSAEVK